MIDRLFFVVLTLNATSLFAFLAPQLGVTIGTVSLVLLIINVLYLIAKIRYSVPVFMHAAMLAWLFILVVWPFFTLLYAPSIEVREIALRLYAFTLVFSTVVYTLSNGLLSIYRVLALSLAVSLIGMGLSILKPDYFETVALLGEKRIEQTGRAFGFFMEPNILAHGLIYLFVGWFALWPRKNTFLEITAVLIFLLVMLFTGSRTGMVVASIIVTFILAHSWKQQLINGRLVLKVCVLVACLGCGVLGLKYYLSSQSQSVNRQALDLTDRVEALLSFKMSNDGGLQDVGSQGRILAQQAYWSYVSQKPLLGYGLGSNSYFYENGVFTKTAHSEALFRALEYGVLYPFLFALMMLLLYARPGRRDAEKLFQTNSVLQFVIVLLLLFTVNGDLFDNRTFYVVWGMFFAAVYYPRQVFNYDRETGQVASLIVKQGRLGTSYRAGKLIPVPGQHDIRNKNAERQRPLKVLHVVPALTAGGAEGFATSLSVELTGLDAQVRVFVLAGARRERGQVLLARLREAGIVVSGEEERSPTSLSNLLRLVHLIQSWRPDIVHAHLYSSEVACVCARWLSAGTAARYIRTLHSTNIQGYRSSTLLRMLNRFYHRTIACSPSVANAYLAFMNKERIPSLVTINNGGQMVDSTPGEEDKRQARQVLGIPEEVFVVAHVGRIGGGGGASLQNEPKAQDTLIKAFAEAFGREGNAMLVLVGDGPLRAEAETLSRSLGVERQIRFLGEQPEPWVALGAADLFCFPSRYEGLPLVLVEAASCGLPVVASDIAEIRALYSGDAWVLCPVDDVAAFAEAMRTVYGNRERFTYCAREATQTFRQQFSMRSCAEKYLIAYKEVATGRAEDFRQELDPFSAPIHPGDRQ